MVAVVVVVVGVVVVLGSLCSSGCGSIRRNTTGELWPYLLFSFDEVLTRITGSPNGYSVLVRTRNSNGSHFTPMFYDEEDDDEHTEGIDSDEEDLPEAAKKWNQHARLILKQLGECE